MVIMHRIIIVKFKAKTNIHLCQFCSRWINNHGYCWVWRHPTITSIVSQVCLFNHIDELISLKLFGTSRYLLFKKYGVWLKYNRHETLQNVRKQNAIPCLWFILDHDVDVYFQSSHILGETSEFQNYVYTQSNIYLWRPVCSVCLVSYSYVWSITVLS